MNDPVEPIPGEHTRFYVRSESKPGTRHLVDLSLNGGSGFCDCQAFSFRCEKNIKAKKPLFSMGEPIVNKQGKISYPNQTICKHVRLVQEYLLPRLLKRLVEYSGRPSLAASSRSLQSRMGYQDVSQAPDARDTREPSSQSKAAGTSEESQPAWLR